MRISLAFLALAASALSAHAAKDVVTATAEKVHPARPHIPNRTFSLADFGGVGDGQTLNTSAFQAAIAAVNRAGGGTLIVPAGVYLTRPFVLCSKLNLHLEEGAVIAAPRTFTEAGMPEPGTMHSQAEAREKENKPEPLITADGVHDLELTGTGTIDGNGAHWWAWSERAGRAQPGRVVYSRPNLVEISNCERLLVSGLTFLNSSRYHLKAENVTDVTVDAVRIKAPFDAPNTDGIDIGPGRNFLVRNCNCDTGDDDICIKGGGVNVLIEDCTILHGHGISIGSGTAQGVDNMLVRHCAFDGNDCGLRIKSMRGAGGLVHNVRYTDIRMRNMGNAIMIFSDYSDNNRPDFKGPADKIPSFHDILFDNITCESTRNAGRIVGLPESRITGITFRDVNIAASLPFEIKDADAPTYVRTIVRVLPPGS